MVLRKYKYFACDFETTVYSGQTTTLVWSSACVQMSVGDDFVDTTPENVLVFGSIEDQLNYFISLNEHIIGYYHNLKFDGSFWLDFFLRNKKFKPALVNDKWKEEKEMLNNEYKYMVSERGQWYTVIFKINNKFIELRDSVKLLPFSLRKLGEEFHTKYKKLDMKYDGFRYPNCPISKEEMEYIKNDVLVLKEAIEKMFLEGNTKLTIGSCCMSEFKKTLYGEYDTLFPDLLNFPLSSKIYGASNADEYIRKSYKGGWCYVKKGCENKIYHNGLTADVNSLYPSRMHSSSGCAYPVGKPTFWIGEIPKEALIESHYFFVTIKCRFYIKNNYLPFIQIKNNALYKGTEMLETSDIFDGDKWLKEYKIGEEYHTTIQTLTLTKTDYYLFLEHYNVTDFEILHGCWFYTSVGIFDTYINHWKEVKINSKGVKRSIAKLFLNNLYGKTASSDDSSFKIAYLNENNLVRFRSVKAHDKKVGYIPVGSAITSYAREFTIRTAQKNFKYFIYADTDSIHCNCTKEQLNGVPIHESEFNHWKLESFWDEAIFARQKTYIEHVTHEDEEKIENPYYNVKCAGMPDRCKKLFVQSMTQEYKKLKEEDLRKEYNEEEINFIKEKRTLKDFKIGLKVPSKLITKRIYGGVLLTNSTYIMRPH